MRTLFLLILTPLTLLAAHLETCYRIYFWFLPVAKSCVIYNRNGKEIRIRSWAKTAVFGRLVKPVNSWGEARLVGLRPKNFSLYQREGNFIRDHIYIFESDGVRYRIVRYKSDGRRVKEGSYESLEELFDPFSASLLIYAETPSFKEVVLKMFYEGKVQTVRYRTLGEERIEINGKEYDVWKVLIVPDIKTKGILKPKGRWIAWVEKETNIPVMLRIKFTIGSANIYLDKVEGHRKLLKEIRDEQARLF